MVGRWIGWLVAAATLGAASGAAAADADFYRGGWRTEGGDPHIYEFVIEGAKVSGLACTHCADGTTLAPLEGTFDEVAGLAFTVRHLSPDGATVAQDRLTARLDGARLVVSGTRGGTAFQQALIKDPRGPVPGFGPQSMLPPGSPPAPTIAVPAGGGGGARPAPYVPPAKWRQLTADDVVGVWIGFGFGMDKQYFLIRKDGERLFGLACGRCDNPYTFGALQDFAIHGETLEFDIVHQDWGDGPVLPFKRHVVANIAMNELHMDARRPDQTGPGIVASLVGPIAIEATAGNVVGQ